MYGISIEKLNNILESNHTGKNSVFYCNNCLGNEKECICNRIGGYDVETGIPIVDVTDDEWRYPDGSQKEDDD